MRAPELALGGRYLVRDDDAQPIRVPKWDCAKEERVPESRRMVELVVQLYQLVEVSGETLAVVIALMPQRSDPPFTLYRVIQPCYLWPAPPCFQRRSGGEDHWPDTRPSGC